MRNNTTQPAIIDIAMDEFKRMVNILNENEAKSSESMPNQVQEIVTE